MIKKFKKTEEESIIRNSCIKSLKRAGVKIWRIENDKRLKQAAMPDVFFNTNLQAGWIEFKAPEEHKKIKNKMDVWNLTPYIYSKNIRRYIDQYRFMLEQINLGFSCGFASSLDDCIKIIYGQ